MIVVKPISLSQDCFSVNSKDGIFFLKDAASNRFVRMNREQEEEFLSTNFAIGYTGKENIRLRIHVSRQAKGLSVFNLEGETLESKRVLLWRHFRGGKLPRFVSDILEAVKAGKTVTMWCISSNDIEVANLVARFVVWFMTNSK